MKLQAGECYRLRNGEVVGPLIARDYESEYMFEDYRKSNSYSWDENGRWYSDHCISDRDIIEHIPKEKDMKEQMIKGSASVYASGTIGHYDIYVTAAEAERLGAEAQRIKADNEVKAGGFVFWQDRILKVEKVKGKELFLCGEIESVLNVSKVLKITNPAHIQALNEIYEGMK